MHAGVDEAGRGPVLGPLAVAAVRGPPSAVPDDVADSKTLAEATRERLAARIDEHPDLDVAVRLVPAREINERMADGLTLNDLETSAFADVLDKLGAERAVVDTVGADADAFGQALADRLDGTTVEARAGADAEDPLVGAASVVAKVRRDARVAALAETVDADIGSGYPSDPTTRAFLSAWREDQATPPPFARRAWSTLEDLGFGTRKLSDYPGGSP